MTSLIRIVGGFQFLIIIFTAILFLNLVGCDEDNNNTVTDPDPDPDNETTIGAVASEDTQLTTLADLIEQAGLDETLDEEGPLTLLAPVNSAFDSLDEGFLESLSQSELAEILSYHIISADTDGEDLDENEQAFATVQEDSVYITIDDSTTDDNIIWINLNAIVIDTDIEASNGRIHKIDDVLLPDAYLDVFEILYKRYQTNKFACTCVSGRTGLQPVLKDVDEEFTIFAPSDAAFDNRTPDVDGLSDADLTNLMNYHIVPGRFLSDDLTDGQTLTARNEEELTISIDEDSTISINDGAVVLTVDIEGINGVVYVIDTVLEPPGD